MTVTYLRRRVDGELEEVQGSYEGSASSLFVFTFLNAYTRGREEEQKLGKAPIYDVLVCYHDFIWSQDPSKESALEELSAQLAEGTTVRGEPIRDSKSYAMTSIRNFFRDFEDVITGEVVCESYDECVHGESASTTDKLCDEGDFDDSPFFKFASGLSKRDRQILFARGVCASAEEAAKWCKLGTRWKFARRFRAAQWRFWAQCGLENLRGLIRSKETRDILDVFTRSNGEIACAAKIWHTTHKKCHEKFIKMLNGLKQEFDGRNSVIQHCLLFKKGKNDKR